MTKPNLSDFKTMKAYQKAFAAYNVAKSNDIASKVPKMKPEIMKRHNDKKIYKPKTGIIGEVIAMRKKIFKITK